MPIEEMAAQRGLGYGHIKKTEIFDAEDGAKAIQYSDGTVLYTKADSGQPDMHVTVVDLGESIGKSVDDIIDEGFIYDGKYLTRDEFNARVKAAKERQRERLSKQEKPSPPPAKAEGDFVINPEKKPKKKGNTIEKPKAPITFATGEKIDWDTFERYNFEAVDDWARRFSEEGKPELAKAIVLLSGPTARDKNTLEEGVKAAINLIREGNVDATEKSVIDVVERVFGKKMSPPPAKSVSVEGDRGPSAVTPKAAPVEPIADKLESIIGDYETIRWKSDETKESVDLWGQVLSVDRDKRTFLVEINTVEAPSGVPIETSVSAVGKRAEISFDDAFDIMVEGEQGRVPWEGKRQYTHEELPSPVTPKAAPEQAIEDFAEEVNQAAAKAPKRTYPTKRLISDVWEEYQKANPKSGLTFNQFKKKLVEAHRAKKIQLSWADIKPESELEGLKKSNIKDPLGTGEEWQYVRSMDETYPQSFPKKKK
jgi:hypothetical protein